jgi:protease-4
MTPTIASEILRGKLLIDPNYAISQLPAIIQMIKDQVPDTKVLQSIRSQKSAQHVTNIPTRKIFSASHRADVYSVTPYTSVDRLPFSTIVVIDIIGPVLKYGGWFSWGTMEMNDLIIRMANTEKVTGIILNIDSPGGQAAGTAEFAQTIREVSKIKPVVAVIQDGYAASAAMWIASAAQEIYVTQPTDQVGSIGAYNTIYDIYGYLAKQGLTVKDIYAPQSVDKNQDYIKALEGDETLIKEDLRFLVEHFISSVKTYRGQRIATVGDEPFTGKMYNAADAKKLGLIDGIKPVAGVVKRIEQLIGVRA